mgnify:CR=1 FL=1|jgi:hypothetical protein
MGWTPTGDSLLGPQGPQGAPGPQGPQGVPGSAGPAPSWGGIGGSLGDQIDLQQALAAKLNASRLTVGPTPPPDPAPGDLWIDTT